MYLSTLLWVSVESHEYEMFGGASSEWCHLCSMSVFWRWLGGRRLSFCLGLKSTIWRRGSCPDSPLKLGKGLFPWLRILRWTAINNQSGSFVDNDDGVKSLDDHRKLATQFHCKQKSGQVRTGKDWSIQKIFLTGLWVTRNHFVDIS